MKQLDGGNKQWNGGNKQWNKGKKHWNGLSKQWHGMEEISSRMKKRRSGMWNDAHLCTEQQLL